MRAIEIKPVRPRVDELLSHYESAIGADYPGYRNHVYRTVTYAMHFLDGAVEDERLVETAMVYHDIGLWTDHELAYLEPSEAVALADNENFGWGLDPAVLRGAIHWHHKVLPYRGPHERIIEACRGWLEGPARHLEVVRCCQIRHGNEKKALATLMRKTGKP